MRATQAESDSRVGVLICLWPALILSPLCFHFSAVVPLHPLLIRALKISFPTQLAFSPSKWCFFFYPPPLSSCGHFLFHLLIKIIIQITEKEFWSFTGEKNIKEPFSRPIRRLLLVATPGLSLPRGAFHLLLCHKVFFFFFFKLHLKGEISGQQSLALLLWFISSETLGCRACKMKRLIIFTLQGSHNIILPLCSCL